MRTRLISLAVTLALAGAMVPAVGCDDRPADLATTRPVAAAPAKASSDANEAAELNREPLPPRALIKLDALEPKIAKPTGKPEDQQPPARTAGELKKATKLMGQRNFSGAIASLERAASFAPKNPVILRLLGQAYVALPNRGKAQENLLAAVKAAPDDLESHLLLGQLATGGQQKVRAIRHLRTALACSQATPKNPRAAETMLILALLLDREGYWTASYECYARLGEWIGKHGRDYVDRATLREWVLRPERLLTRRGAILLLLRRPKEALAILERSYRRNRASGRTAGLLVEAMLTQKMHDRAERLLLDMIDLPSQKPNMPAMLGALCRQSGDRDLPLRFWKAVEAQNKREPDIAAALARAAFELGWNPQAIAVLESAATTQPDSNVVWRLLASHYASEGKYPALVDSIQRRLAFDANSVESMAEAMANIAASAQKPGDERRLAQLARKSESPQQHALLYLAGLFASAKNKHLLAADLYQRAADKKPDFYRAHEALLETYLAQSRDDLVDRLLEEMSSEAGTTYLPHYMRGKVQLRRGDVDKAVASLREAHRLKSKDSTITLLFADALQAAWRRTKEANYLNEAVKVLIQTIREHPEKESAGVKLFQLLLAGRKFDDARRLVAQLQIRNPDSIATRIMRVELALVEKKTKEAMALLKKLSAVAPQNAEVQVLMAKMLLGTRPGIIRKADFDNLADKLSAIVRAQPANRKARLTLGDLMTAVEKHAEAAAVYAPAFENRPDDQEIVQRYVLALADANEPATALATVEKYLADKDRASDLWARAKKLQLLVELDRTIEARQLAKTWIAESEDVNIHAMYRQTMFQLLDDHKDYEGALVVLNDWIASHRAGASILRALKNIKIRLLGMTGRYDDAGKLVTELTANEPLDLAGQRLAFAAMDRGDCEKCLDILDACIKTTTKFADDVARLKKAIATFKTEGAPAQPAYETAVAKLPPGQRLTVASQVAAKQFDKAIGTVAGLAVNVENSQWSMRALKLLALDKDKQRDRALALAETWVADHPTVLEARRLLLGELSEQKMFARAVKLLRKWKSDDLFAQPTTASAELPAPDADANPRRWLDEMTVRIRVAAGKPAEALRLADEVVKVYPKDPNMLALRSTVLGELGRDDQAEKVMTAALAISPTNPSFNNNMAYVLAVRGHRLDEAMSMARLATAVRPTETAYADTLGWVFYKQGRVVMAGRFFQRLVTIVGEDEPGAGVIYDHAGDVYWRLGWHDRALELWRKALELGRKADTSLRETKELLENVPKKIDAVEKGTNPPTAPLSDSARPEDFSSLETGAQTPIWPHRPGLN